MGKIPSKCSVANRMSWASQRQTTRVEDLAYCLMGLFRVNMPLIYGEKQKAFFRLQTEIMKISEDYSLFAWRTSEIAEGSVSCGLLASQPAWFSGSRNVAPFAHSSDIDSHPPFSMTSRGVHITLRLVQVGTWQFSVSEGSEMFFATLDCQDTIDSRGPLGVFLVRTSGGCFRRYLPHRIPPASEVGHRPSREETIYVAQDNDIRKSRVQWPLNLHISELPKEISQQGVNLKIGTNDERSNAVGDPIESRLNLRKLSPGLGAALYLSRNGSPGGVVLLVGLDLTYVRNIESSIFSMATVALEKDRVYIWSHSKFPSLGMHGTRSSTRMGPRHPWQRLFWDTGKLLDAKIPNSTNENTRKSGGSVC